MDDLLSQVAAQFQEDVANEVPKKEELKNEEVVKERFKVSEQHIQKRREMIELSKVEDNDSDSSIFKKKSKKVDNSPKETKKEEKSGYNSGYGGYGYYGKKETKKESDVRNEKAAEYADNVVDALRVKMNEEYNGAIPQDWDIFDIHSTANKKHTIVKETKKNGNLPFRIKTKLAVLKGCVYLGHSTLETLYVLKNE